MQLDIVALNGAAFIARRNNPDTCPGPDWQAIAMQGKPGQRGLKGDRGERGPPSVAPRLARSYIDENYDLILLWSDESRNVIPLRAAFERYHHEAVK